ncbi:MAG: GIY-YIG nuclease family protein [Candidatus Poribacteria bacterium]|nr:GIY-YIG nuclease family protein [Candidatus Poribacteria bacterium]
MDNQYKYSEQPLNLDIAYELIRELFIGKSAKVMDIKRAVDVEHEKGGGKGAETKVHPATNALNKMKKQGLADNPKLGTWEIYESEDPNGSSKIIGSGKGCVYLYYYPIYRKYAELQEEKDWPCKIGCSENYDPNFRIKEQGTAMPEKPELGLVIRTDKPIELEKGIHDVLKATSKHMTNAPGKEWFRTAPNEIKKIYDVIIKNYTSEQTPL